MPHHNVSLLHIMAPREDNFTSNLSPTSDLLFGSYMASLVVLTLILNLVVLVTVAKTSRRLHPLEVYVVNLAVVDICPAVFEYPLTAYSAFNHGWAFGNLGCTMCASVVYFFGIASISTVTVMSVMRYIKTCHQSHRFRITHRFVYLSLVPVYGNSLVWALAPALGWGSYAVEPHGNACTLNWGDLSLSYIICMFGFIYILPCFLISFSYCRICCFMRKMTLSMQLVTNRMDKYMAKLTFAMTFLFMSAWTPYAILALYFILSGSHTVPLSVATLAPAFAKSSSLVNPIVYFLAIKRFRQEVAAIFLPWVSKDNQQKDSLLNETKASCINMESKLLQEHVSALEMSGMEPVPVVNGDLSSVTLLDKQDLANNAHIKEDDCSL